MFNLSFTIKTFLINPAKGGIPPKDKKLNRKKHLIHNIPNPPRRRLPKFKNLYLRILMYKRILYTLKNIKNGGSPLITLIIIHDKFINLDTANTLLNLILIIPDLNLNSTVRASNSITKNFLLNLEKISKGPIFWTVDRKNKVLVDTSPIKFINHLWKGADPSLTIILT